MWTTIEIPPPRYSTKMSVDIGLAVSHREHLMPLQKFHVFLVLELSPPLSLDKHTRKLPGDPSDPGPADCCAEAPSYPSQLSKRTRQNEVEIRSLCSRRGSDNDSRATKAGLKQKRQVPIVIRSFVWGEHEHLSCLGHRIRWPNVNKQVAVRFDDRETEAIYNN